MWMVAGFIIGAVLGSFVKAIADRSLISRSFLGRSYCPHCKHRLRWYDLLPILSYFLLRGRCRYCGDKISLEYLIVEVVMGFLIGFLFWQSFQNFNYTLYLPDLIFQTFFITILAILFLTDLKKMFIPDRVILPAIVISIIFIFFITVIKVIFLYYTLTQTRLGQLLLPFFYSILTAIIIGGFFWILILVTKGKGMGGGDVKLGAFMGLGLGLPNAFLALMLAFFIGALWATLAIILGKKKLGQHIAFGPFLVTGSLIALFWGSEIMEWYLNLKP